MAGQKETKSKNPTLSQKARPGGETTCKGRRLSQPPAGRLVICRCFLPNTCTGVRKSCATLPRAVHRHASSVDDFACRTFRFRGHGLHCAHDHTGEQAHDEHCSCGGLHHSFLLFVGLVQSSEWQAIRGLRRPTRCAIAGLQAGMIRKKLRRRFRGLRCEASQPHLVNLAIFANGHNLRDGSES